MTSEGIKVVFADDNQADLELMQIILESEPGMKVVAALSTADRLCAEVERYLPQVAVVDLHMPGRKPLEAIAEIARRFPETRVMVLSGSNEPEVIDEAFAAGASGYVTKGRDTNAVVNAIRQVAEGKRPILT